jgi:hypothetical protein
VTVSGQRWRQGGKVPHHLYAQRDDVPDRRPWPDGDPPIGMFLDPADAMTACLAVNALPYAAPGDARARVNPEGFVAQRFDRDFNGHGNWVLTHIAKGALAIQVFTDEEVADWAPLMCTPGEAP